MPPRFSFLPSQFISCPPRYFFGRKKLLFLAGKNVEICDFRQKKPSDFGEDLFFFFWRSPGFSRKKTLKFRPEKAFGNRRKPLPPPISRSWRRPWPTATLGNQLKMTALPKTLRCDQRELETLLTKQFETRIKMLDCKQLLGPN